MNRILSNLDFKKCSELYWKKSRIFQGILIPSKIEKIFIYSATIWQECHSEPVTGNAPVLR
jgi:hypothetical protein